MTAVPRISCRRSFSRSIGTSARFKTCGNWKAGSTRSRHALSDYYRGKEQPGVSLETAEALGLAEDLPDEDVIGELFPAVRVMVNSLPERDRQALVLTEYQGLSQKEIAELLGLSFSGAKSRVQRARAKLKHLLLQCCHFELDRRGGVINYQPRCQCCAIGTCGCEEHSE